MKKFNYIDKGISLNINIRKCVGCGLCSIVCPHQILEIKDKKVRIVNKSKCMECGACEANCPTDAIKVNSGVGCAIAILNSKKFN